MVRCGQCHQGFHRGCLGLPEKSCFAGFIDHCVECAMWEMKLWDTEAVAEASELHKKGLGLAAASKAEGTMGNHFSYLFGSGASVKTFAEKVLYVELHEIMPPGKGEGMSVLVVGMYLVWASGRLAVSSLANYVNAIAQWHKAKRIPREEWPTEHPSISERLAGLKRVRGEKDGGRGAKAPISIGLLGVMKGYWEERAKKDPEVKLLAMKQIVLLVVGFFGLLRGAALVQLRLKDMEVYEWDVKVRIRKSKADQYKKGADVRLAAVSKSGFEIRKLVEEYVGVLRAGGRGDEDFLFPGWDRDTRTLGSKGLKKGSVADVVRDTLVGAQKMAKELEGMSWASWTRKRLLHTV